MANQTPNPGAVGMKDAPKPETAAEGSRPSHGSAGQTDVTSGKSQGESGTSAQDRERASEAARKSGQSTGSSTNR